MSEWVDYRIGEHIAALSGAPFLSSLFSDEDGTPLIRIRDLLNGRTELKYLGSYEQKYLINDGDVLIGMDGDFHLVKWKGGEALLNQRILRLVEKRDSDLNMDFIYYWLDPYLLDVHAKTAATTVKHLSTYDVVNAVVKAPSYKDQQKIAHILTTVDNLIEKTQAIIDKYTAVKQGMMHDLFTRGIDLATGQLRPSYEQAPELYKETELGWVPREWGVCAIREVAVVKGGKRLPAGTPFADGITPFPYLRVTDMVNGGIDDSVLVYVDEQTEQYISRYKIYKDDIYVTIAGTLGMFGRIPKYLDGAQLTENAARITDIDPSKFNIDYLCGFLRSDYLLPQFNAAVGIGAGVPKLALYHIEGFKSPCPSLREQELVVASIKSVDALQAEQLAALGKLQSQKKGLMQDLLTGRVMVG